LLVEIQCGQYVANTFGVVSTPNDGFGPDMQHSFQTFILLDGQIETSPFPHVSAMSSATCTALFMFAPRPLPVDKLQITRLTFSFEEEEEEEDGGFFKRFDMFSHRSTSIS
jgi:hypothetical protein